MLFRSEKEGVKKKSVAPKGDEAAITSADTAATGEEETTVKSQFLPDELLDREYASQ